LVGQWLGLHATDRLHRLVLANTAAKIGETDAWNTRVATVRKDGMSAIVPGTMERWFTGDFRERNPVLIAATEATLASTDPEGYVACCAVVRDADFRASVQQISVPTMVIAGSFDPATPPSDGRFLAGNIPGAEYLELSAAHISCVEAGDEFSDALIRFLT
jgi:3-oxoadipate enol-lactonase